MTDISSRRTLGALAAVLLFMLLSHAGRGQNSAAADQTPPQLRPPQGAKLILHARAKGDQVYTCKGDGTQYSWTLKEPQAELSDESGKVIGHHFAGPAWQLNDNSQVTGKVVARSDSPDTGAIPWLLLAAVDHSGTGLMSNVGNIQRLNTKGGKAPNPGCDASHSGAETRVAYSADYFFYSSPSGQ
jgi:hypothetical protein